MFRLLLNSCLTLALILPASALRAQDRTAQDPVPSQCLAIAQSVPKDSARVFYANFTPAPLKAQARGGGDVTITYAGHSTYVIETPAGVRIATDFSGMYGSDPLPRVVTMNKAHSTHFTASPDPRIEHVLRGWNPEGGPARHAVVVEDAYIRNVPTDIRRWGEMEKDGNSIFIVEVAGLCIGHLGHLHHGLEDAHYGAIGRLDIVMVPIDGGMTMSVDAVSEITRRLYSSIVLPMHRHATPLSEFTSRMGGQFALDMRDARSFTVSLRNLPSRPTILVLKGV